MEWKTAWSYLPVNYNINIGTVSNITQRTSFRNNLNGTKIRIKFSNLYSKQPLILEEVVIGKKDRSEAEIEGIKKITFQGNDKIVIEPGKEFDSDEIDFSLCSNDDIIISVYVRETTEICSVCSTWAARSWNTRYGLNGNFVNEQEFEETDSVDVFPVLKFDCYKANNLFGITEIKVYTDSDVKTLTLFGDSITHMSYYSDALIEKLYKCYPGKITVINRGLGGNRLLHDYSRVADVPGGGTIFGNAGIERFCHDVYGSDHPEIVIVLIGINDFVHPYAFKHYDEAVSVEEYREGISKLIQIAHENGSKMMIGTLTPCRQDNIDWYAPAEELRQKANEWIREQKVSDGIIDFDRAIRKTDDLENMLDTCHLGDKLHPNAAGGKKMADAVPIGWFTK